LLIALAACGASPRGPIDDQALPPAPPLSLEWKAAQADGDQVAITLVVDGRPIELGVLPAATEMEPGTPATCALRSASLDRTELTCGDLTSRFGAELGPDALAIYRVDGNTRTELRRIEVYAGSLAVAPYRLPTAP
jgi:hypothetical protein